MDIVLRILLAGCIFIAILCLAIVSIDAFLAWTMRVHSRAVDRIKRGVLGKGRQI